MHSRICTVRGFMPIGRSLASGAPGTASAITGCAGGLRRNTSDSGSIVTTQNTPMPMYVWRQPTESMKNCMTGGQIAPAT